MERMMELEQKFSKIGDALLLIWWGTVMIVHPLTVGMGAIGTGVILIGMNAARMVKGIPAKIWTNAVGVAALAWGILDTVFDPRFEISFAILLIVSGTVSLLFLLVRSNNNSQL